MKKDFDEIIFTNRIEMIRWFIKIIWEIDILKLEKFEKNCDKTYYIKYKRIVK